MIEGLKVTINGEELRELCLKQVEHHRERVKAYTEQIANLEKSQIEGMQYSNGDPTKALTDRMNVHANQASEMEFVAKYLALGEDYLLGRDDLHKLGIFKNLYH